MTKDELEKKIHMMGNDITGLQLAIMTGMTMEEYMETRMMELDEMVGKLENGDYED